MAGLASKGVFSNNSRRNPGICNANYGGDLGKTFRAALYYYGGPIADRKDRILTGLPIGTSIKSYLSRKHEWLERPVYQRFEDEVAGRESGSGPDRVNERLSDFSFAT